MEDTLFSINRGKLFDKQVLTSLKGKLKNSQPCFSVLLHDSYGAKLSHGEIVFLPCPGVIGSRAHITKKDSKPKLYDHRPRTLDNDNYLRVLQIPKKKVV